MTDTDVHATEPARKDDIGERRRPGLRAAAAILPAVTRRALGRGGLAHRGLVTDWPSIVGPEIAARCLPRKIRFAQPGCRLDATLTLRVESGWALELQHLEPLVIERINSYFGYRAVARLRYQQGAMPCDGISAPPALPSLSLEEEETVRAQIAGVGDEALRAALERLGCAIRRRAHG